MAITLRANKGSELTQSELDDNFDELDTRVVAIEGGEFASGLTVTGHNADDATASFKAGVAQLVVLCNDVGDALCGLTALNAAGDTLVVMQMEASEYFFNVDGAIEALSIETDGTVNLCNNNVEIGATGSFFYAGISLMQDGSATFGDSVSVSGPLMVNGSAIGSTSTDGLELLNTNPAAAGSQQWSPRLRITGQGWKTNTTAASQSTDWILENQPVQGTANPKSLLALSYSVNGGAYSRQFAFSLNGTDQNRMYGDGSSPFLELNTNNGSGLYYSTTGFIAGASARVTVSGTSTMQWSADDSRMGSAGTLSWAASGTPSNASDTIISRGGAATVQYGAANAASTVAQTIQAQGSRSGTDTNIGGANLTIQSGSGTGTGAASSLIFKTPVVVASGTGVQTMTTALTLASGLATFSGLTTITQASENAGILASTGYSLTGSNATPAFDWSGTINTSGSPDIVAWRLTDTARGASTTFMNLYGGSAGTTSVFQIANTGQVKGPSGNAGTNCTFGVVGNNNYGMNINLGVGSFSFSVNTAGPAAITSGGFICADVRGYGWNSGSSVLNAATFDTALHRNAAGVVEVNNGTINTYRDLKVRDIIVNGATNLLKTSAALTDNAGGGAGTLTNAPATGNPTKWCRVDDNGTARYIPMW